MLKDLELIIQNGHRWDDIFSKGTQLAGFNQLDSDALRPRQVFLCRNIESGHVYYLDSNPASYSEIDRNQLREQWANFEVYAVDYAIYEEKRRNNFFKVIANYDVAGIERAIGASSDGIWQASCSLVADQVAVDPTQGLKDVTKAPANAWNIGTQIGFPAAIGLVAGVAHVTASLIKASYEKEGKALTDVEKSAIYRNSKAFAAKLTAAMGGWELGLFVGQCLLTVCSTTPFTAWVPLVLSISAGIFQGITAVAAQIADEKLKFGEVRSSKTELAKLFLTSFITGAAWQLANMFAPLISVLKPLSDILVSVITGAVTTIVSYVTNKIISPRLEVSDHPVTNCGCGLFSHHDNPLSDAATAKKDDGIPPPTMGEK